MLSLPLAGSNWRVRDTVRASKWFPAVVPGCVHRDLLRLGLVPAALLTEDGAELVADGLDTVATVRLNGRDVARTENMFVGYRWNVKRLLRPGRNELRIRFGSAMRY